MKCLILEHSFPNTVTVSTLLSVKHLFFSSWKVPMHFPLSTFFNWIQRRIAGNADVPSWTVCTSKDVVKIKHIFLA